MQLSYLEDFDSKIPAIQVLCALGWRYLGREGLGYGFPIRSGMTNRCSAEFHQESERGMI
jgi:hypothetical protein